MSNESNISNLAQYINKQCSYVYDPANMTDHLSPQVNTLLDAVANILYALTVIANCICIHIMFSTPHLRKTSAFVMYQSCNDALFALVSIVLFLSDKTLSEWLLLSSPGILHSYISYSCIILVSFDRWIYLIYPEFHNSITSKKIVLVIGSSLVTSFFVSCPFCTCDSVNAVHSYFILTHQYILPCFHGVCFFLLLFIYVHISYVLYTHYKQISRLNKSVTDVSTYRKNIEDLNSKKWNSFIFVFLVSCSYLLTVSPFTGVKAYAFIADSPTSKNFFIMNRIAQFFHTISHFSNFLVFVWKCPGFKDTFLENMKNLEMYLKAPFVKCRGSRRDNSIEMSAISSETLSYRL